jgi:DNA-directed RNA polymerase specialized sigma24 family protein
MQTIYDSITSVTEAKLVAAARDGETSGLVEYLYLHCLPAQATRLVKGFRDAYGARLDVDDVVQVGIEGVLRSLDRALSGANPVAWLRRAAQFRMLDYCEEARSLIRVPACSQRHGRGHVPYVASLDAPLAGTDDLTLLDLIAG